MAPPSFVLQERISFLPWLNSFGLLLFFLPKSWSFPSLFWVFLAGNGRLLEVLSKKNFFPFIAWLLWKVLGRPLDLWTPGGFLLNWRMKEGSCYLWCGDQSLLDGDVAPPGLRRVAGSVAPTCLALGENVTPQVETLVHY